MEEEKKSNHRSEEFGETSEQEQGKQSQTPEETVEETSEDIKKVKAVSAISYLIFFLPLLTNPESKFAKFHANQALLLLITSLAVNVVGTIIPILGWFLILPLGFIFVLVLFIMGIVNALNGKMQRLPLIGGFDILK